MSREAVKFGRMSKKQREKVEDEVNTIFIFEMFSCCVHFSKQ